MPRQKKQTALPVLKPISEPEIVPDGDYAGMTYDEVLDATTGAIYESLGDVTIDTASCAIGIVVGEFLDKSARFVGPAFAKECATNYIETCIPFVREDILPEEQMTVKQLMEKNDEERGAGND